MQKLTQRVVDNFALPQQKCVILRDTELKGFGLRSTSGGKAFIVEARVKGKSKRITIGRADLLSVEEAREKAIILLAKMTSGIDPQEEKAKAEAANITLGEVLDYYLSLRQFRQSYRKSMHKAITRHLEDWLNKPIASITGEMVLTRHKTLGAVAISRGNDTIKYLGTLLNFAISNFDLSIRNPVSIMYKNRAWFKNQRAASVIADHQLPAWYRTVMKLKRKEVRDFLLLTLLTGLRRSEALALRWDCIDFETMTLTIPAEFSKNYMEHKLPLSDLLVVLLSERKKACGVSPWVFPRMDNLELHMSNPQDAMKTVVNQSDVYFSPHCLRRTFTTVSSRMGTPHHIVRKLINHSQVPDITSQYIIIGIEAMREPMQKISERFLELMRCDQDEWLMIFPAASKKTLKTPTLAEVLRAYLLSRKLRLTTQTNYEKCIRVDVGDWLGLPVTTITEKMVAERKAELLKRKGTLTVNQTLCILRALMYFATENYETPAGQSLIADNPVKSVQRYSEKSFRQTFIPNSVLPKWYSAVMATTWASSRDYMIFVLMTGMRKHEAMSLKWADIDFGTKTIKIPAELCKNAHGYALPMSQFLEQFLRHRKRIVYFGPK